MLIYQNDDGVRLSFTLTKQDGTPWVLSSAVLVMAGGIIYNRQVHNLTIDDAQAGTCHYDLSAEDTAMPGEYELQVRVNGARTLGQGKLTIKEAL